jgi:hypothetical protein
MMSEGINFSIMGEVPRKWAGRFDCLVMGYLMNMKDENNTRMGENNSWRGVSNSELKVTLTRIV